MVVAFVTSENSRLSGSVTEREGSKTYRNINGSTASTG